MKKVILLCLLAGWLPALAQSPDDQSLILQQCFDLPQLQGYFPKDAAGNIRQLVILDHGVVLNQPLQATKNGISPVVLSKQGIAGGQADAYFLFNDLSVRQDKAHVAFAYYYSPGELVSVTIELSRLVTGWTIQNAKLLERHENN